MSLQSGTRVGAYEIVELLGQGGMGEVYRAREPKLERDVAIKLLPEAMTTDRERVLRFEREARLLASLNHSNIAAVYGFDSFDGRHYLALEFVDGETLAGRLVRGPLPMEEALEVARQVAEALEAAHDRGIVHRDLKPANVMVRADGTVKVLDFGLAKAVTDEASESEIANSPTITADYTQPGVVLGTAAYMSPEQARGRPLDKRTDIWSFGVILYEMLTGETLFRGETATDSMGAIMHREPQWSSLPSTTPPTIQLLLRRCLSKNRKRRLHDIADARVELEEAISDPTNSSLSLAHVALEEAERADRPRRRWPWVTAAFLAGALIVAGGAALLQPAPVERPLRRFEFATDLEPRGPVLSPNGASVAFISEGNIYLRNLAELESRMVWSAEARRARGLLWSPDSAWLGFHSQGKVFKIAAAGGEPIQLTDEMISACAWLADGRIVGTHFTQGLVQLSDQGGPIKTLVPSADDELHLHGGGALPDGHGVLFSPHPMDGDARSIYVGTPSGTRHFVYECPHAVLALQYAASGHILFGQKEEPAGTWALPFDLERLEVTGQPRLVLPKVRDVAVSGEGALVYARHSDSVGTRTRLVWVDRTGQVMDTVGPILNNATGIALSPDGRRVAVAAHGLDDERGETAADIWIVDVERGTAEVLAHDPYEQSDPLWSPDGSRIAYTSMKTLGISGVDVRAADGSGTPERLIDDALSFSPNDTWTEALVTYGKIPEHLSIARMTLDDPSARTPVVDSGFDFMGLIRPGGRLFAYLSGRPMDRMQQLFIKRHPEGEGRWKVSMDPVGPARWSRTGEHLYYVTVGDGFALGDLIEVPIILEDSAVRIGAPVTLMSMAEHDFNDFDLSLDGERFIMLQKVQDEQPDEVPREGVVLIQNWPALLSDQ